MRGFFRGRAEFADCRTPIATRFLSAIPVQQMLYVRGIRHRRTAVPVAMGDAP